MKKPFRLAVKAVIADGKGCCLLIRRSHKCRNLVGKWEWPGGKVNPGEDFATAVVRETKEETSLEVGITGVAGATHFEMAAANIVLLCLETRLIAGEVRLSDEHDDFAWVPFGESARYQLVSGVGDFMLDYAKRKGTTS
ncbi:MAG: NUDIX domain-containing protein [Planctomycetes bacterium]|nr:NUDIX domain-containing protein [Planctomycetota bacterium]